MGGSTIKRWKPRTRATILVFTFHPQFFITNMKDRIRQLRTIGIRHIFIRLCTAAVTRNIRGIFEIEFSSFFIYWRLSKMRMAECAQLSHLFFLSFVFPTFFEEERNVLHLTTCDIASSVCQLQRKKEKGTRCYQRQAAPSRGHHIDAAPVGWWVAFDWKIPSTDRRTRTDRWKAFYFYVYFAEWHQHFGSLPFYVLVRLRTYVRTYVRSHLQFASTAQYAHQ